MLEDWTIYSWYCPNCKTQVAGLKNKKNQIRSELFAQSAALKWFAQL